MAKPKNGTKPASTETKAADIKVDTDTKVAKTVVAGDDEAVALKAKIAEQEKQMADMMAQMKVMMAAQSAAVAKPSDEPKRTRSIKFINMTVGGLTLRGNRFYHMDKQFEPKMIPESEARAIVSNMPNTVANGMVYIADADFVRDVELDGVYEEMLSDEQMKALLSKSANEVCEIYQMAAPAQKEIIIDMVASRKMNNLPIDANIVVELGKLCGKDLMGIEPEDE